MASCSRHFPLLRLLSRRAFVATLGAVGLAASVAVADGVAPEISPEQLRCIRRLRFVWAPNVESGGPMVDPEAPFGSAHAYDDLAQIAPDKSRSELKRLYAEVMSRLPAFTEMAKIRPGSYALPAQIVRRLEQFSPAGASGIRADGAFEFTAEHAKLIAAMRWWYTEPKTFAFVFGMSLDPRDWGGHWPVATINFKRPFGDMTAFELDMADILGLRLDHETRERLDRLYGEMHAALQIFVRHAEL